MTGCPDDDTLGALVASGLSEPEREAIAIHAASCEVCHAMLGMLSPSATTADERDGAEELVLAPGTQIGRYTIESRIGAGGMGVVYSAHDRELERRVALKLLRPNAGDERARERLVREARTLARLSHPNIVAVFDAGEHRGHVFVVMELVDGGSVLAWCSQHRRTQDAILDCVIAAGRGLAAAHVAGIVHRDVKPDNILVGRDDRARVTDFGLARLDLEPTQPDAADGAPNDAPATLTRTGTLLGTPAYMPPEVLRGASTARSDQWAYCATVYELLAGTRPFPIDPVARAIAIDQGRLAAPVGGRGMPAAVRAVLGRGLRADPDARWDTMAAAVAALERARRRTRRIVVSAAAVVLLGAGGVATAVALREPPAKPAGFAMTWRDNRDGCNCPSSACDGRCVSVCTAPDWKFGKPVPGISVPGRQEALHGASENGDAVLYLAGDRCALDHLYLARRAGDTYVPVDLTPQIDTTRFEILEQCCTLSPEGDALILRARGNHQFFIAKLDGDRVLPPTLALDPQFPDDTWLGGPVLAPGGRTLYFNVAQSSGTGSGPLDGIYQAERADDQSPFASARFVPGMRRYDIITGISPDQLSLFVKDEYATRVLVRTSTDEPWGEPVPNPPTRLYGWRTIPIEGCQRLLTTYTPGGCRQEDINFMEPTD